ncbi:hypothetical protein V6N13_014707 [Hibiscus sabdariffa]|uniref:Uncharacterized protein n=1 Tax=Hibiscus sabdariffa TaxID=183260 RepID=A0ABR2RW87_9ROSI
MPAFWRRNPIKNGSHEQGELVTLLPSPSSTARGTVIKLHTRLSNSVVRSELLLSVLKKPLLHVIEAAIEEDRWWAHPQG